jgi:2,3-bisphosphoglycerate-independent phosphoglycerate mutase
MKFVVLLGDGMADHPIESLGGRTPLQAASTPNMDAIARKGRSGRSATVPPGLPPGSDVANLAVMGYNPRQYYSGRAPLEAASMGVALDDGDIAFRCNFVTVQDGNMLDYSAGHITTEEGQELIAALKIWAPSWRIYPGVSYRNLLVLRGGNEAVTTPPHDIMDKPIKDYLPRGEGSELLMEIMEAASAVLYDHPVNQRRIANGNRPANMIWLWGQGPRPSMPTFSERFGLEGAMISAVDLLKGIGIYAGLEVAEVPGATGTIDTNYQGKVEACLDALNSRDFVYLHIEAPDEAAHEGNLELKIKAIELFDQKVVGPVLDGLEKSGYKWRVAVLPDHPTPISIRTHTGEPVPFAIMGDGIKPDGAKPFDEEAAKDGGFGLIEGQRMIERLIGV